MNFTLPLDYALFMADTENCFPDKRKASINNAIKDFIKLKHNGINPNLYINEVLFRYNLKECQLTSREINYINAQVDKG